MNIAIAITLLVATTACAQSRSSQKGISSPNIFALSRNDEARVQATLKTLSLEEKVGQMLQVRYFADYESFNCPQYMALLNELQTYHVGSIALGLHSRGPNLVKISPLQAAKVANQLQTDSKLPLLVGADLERGLASRLEGVPSFPFAMAFGAIGNVADAYQFGLMTAREARAAGFNWSFGPVADVNSNPSNPIINTRSFGDDPEAVAGLVAAFIEGAHAGGLLVTAKHFPGHGNASSDSHKEIPIVGVDQEHLDHVEFPPFASAIRAGVDSVLIEHARVPALDSDPTHVATTSRAIIEGILRERLGFKGLVVTDALEMRGLMDLYRSQGQTRSHARPSTRLRPEMM